MNKKINKLIIACAFFSSYAFSHNIELNKPLAKVEIQAQGELVLNKQRVSYQAWNTEQLKGKVRIVQAMAGRMSSKNMNAHVVNAIIAANFPRASYQTTSILNQDDALIGTASMVKSSLESSKKEFPHSTMILDSEGKAAQAWQLAKKSSAIILLDKEGVVRFVKEGKLSDNEVNELISKTKQLVN